MIQDQITGEEKEDGTFAGNVYGTYVHGIFDREEVISALVGCLARKKGISLERAEASVDYRTFKERQYDLLAEGLRQSLDLERIYEILEQGA